MIKALINKEILKREMKMRGLKQKRIGRLRGVCHQTEVSLFAAIGDSQPVSMSMATLLAWILGVEPQELVAEVLWPAPMVRMAENCIGPLPCRLRDLLGIQMKVGTPTESEERSKLRQQIEQRRGEVMSKK